MCEEGSNEKPFEFILWLEICPELKQRFDQIFDEAASTGYFEELKRHQIERRSSIPPLVYDNASSKVNSVGLIRRVLEEQRGEWLSSREVEARMATMCKTINYDSHFSFRQRWELWKDIEARESTTLGCKYDFRLLPEVSAHSSFNGSSVSEIQRGAIFAKCIPEEIRREKDWQISVFLQGVPSFQSESDIYLTFKDSHATSRI